MSAEKIPLFPLSVVLLPRGRIALQVFEQRYLDLVSQCLKTDTGFGVVWLTRGSEVITASKARSGSRHSNRLADIGTYAKIVDWDTLPNGLLGITVEGEKKFQLLACEQQANQLYTARVKWLDAEPIVPLDNQALELHGLLLQLLAHPVVERLNISASVEDVSHLTFLLTQLMPIDEAAKFELLAHNDAASRLEHLVALLSRLSS